MDIEKLYQSIILRDILEYLTPGSIVFFSICLITEVFLQVVGSNFSVLSSVNNSSIFEAIVFLVISYSLGHFLTSLDKQFFRTKESDQEKKFLSKDTWFNKEVKKAICHYTGISITDIESKIISPTENNPSKILREIVRSIVFNRSQPLFREFIIRHSILSRFCKNMALALIILLFSMIISIILNWKQSIDFLQDNTVTTIIYFVVMVCSIIFAIYQFIRQSEQLRETMIKHTFQILYADFVTSKLISEEQEREDRGDS